MGGVYTAQIQEVRPIVVVAQTSSRGGKVAHEVPRRCQSLLELRAAGARRLATKVMEEGETFIAHLLPAVTQASRGFASRGRVCGDKRFAHIQKRKRHDHIHRASKGSSSEERGAILVEVCDSTAALSTLHWARVHFQEHADQGWWDSARQGSHSLRVGRPYKTLQDLDAVKVLGSLAEAVTLPCHIPALGIWVLLCQLHFEL